MPAKLFTRAPLLGGGVLALTSLTALLVYGALTPSPPPAALPPPPPLADLPLGSPAAPRTAVAPPTAVPPPASVSPAALSPASPAARRPAPTSSPAARADLTAALTVPAGWEDGYVAEIKVTNTGRSAVRWTVTVTNAARLKVRLTNAWNATATQKGDTVTLRGQLLPPGRSITAGYQVAAAAGSHPRPTACTLTGSTCRIG